MAEAENEKTYVGHSQDKVRLVASSEDIALQRNSLARSSDSKQPDGYFMFESAQWTADGTTILTAASTNDISGYVIPENLLAPQTEPLSLSPQATIALGERTNVLASAPYYNLLEPYTNQVLVSSRDHPIQLFYLFPPLTDGSTPSRHSPASSYPLTKARSEYFLSATSLIWPSPGSHFIAGCRNLLAKFDITRTGEEPLLRIKTIPSERHLSKGGGVGMRGTVSTLSAAVPHQSYGSLVAAGTWTRWVGLYDFTQAGECTATWSIESAARDLATQSGGGIGGGIGGDGITQTIWSPCGRYLLISERKSKGILVYDVRVTGKLLGWLEGREALGNQRISCDVFPQQEGSGGFEVWSGTTSGTNKVWEGVGQHEGGQEPAWEWQPHKSAVGSTCLHPTGTVIATCSGSWEFPDVEEAESLQSFTHEVKDNGQDTNHLTDWMRRRNKESTLKIWSLDCLNSVCSDHAS
ncbi:hypothetical protein BJ170DRAFT_680490 [Xylariales sp. AK1849]|nr:hypothetical protein BJ170DRAFT_680490 [Xylariales sp. AK1849]